MPPLSLPNTPPQASIAVLALLLAGVSTADAYHGGSGYHNIGTCSTTEHAPGLNEPMSRCHKYGATLLCNGNDCFPTLGECMTLCCEDDTCNKAQFSQILEWEATPGVYASKGRCHKCGSFTNSAQNGLTNVCTTCTSLNHKWRVTTHKMHFAWSNDPPVGFFA